jgi:hypothetical protein
MWYLTVVVFAFVIIMNAKNAALFVAVVIVIVFTPGKNVNIYIAINAVLWQLNDKK